MKKIFKNKIFLIILLAIFFVLIGSLLFTEKIYAQAPAAPAPEAGAASSSAGAAGEALNQPAVNSSIGTQTGPAPATAAAAVGESLGTGTTSASGATSGSSATGGNSSKNFSSSSICKESAESKEAIGEIATATQANPLTKAVRGSGVSGIWKWLLGVIDYLIAAMLIFIAIVNILQIQIDTYAIRKALPNLIMGVILANLSWFFCLALVDLSTAIVNWEQIQGGGNLLGTLSYMLFEPLTVASQYLGVLIAVMVGTGIGGVPGILTGFLGFFLGLIVFLIPIALFLAIWFLLFIRIYVVEFLVAVSPLAFFAIGFPMTAKFFQQWWDQFWKWVFMAPLVFFLWVFALVIMQNWNGQVIKYIVVCALLYFSLILPFKLGGAIMAAWGNLGKAISGTGKGGYFHRQAQSLFEASKTSIHLGARETPVIGWLMGKKEQFEGSVAGKKKVIEGLQEEEMKTGLQKVIWSRLGTRNAGTKKLMESDATNLGGILNSSGRTAQQIADFGHLATITVEPNGTLTEGGMKVSESRARKYFAAIDALAKRERHGRLPGDRTDAARLRGGRQDVFEWEDAYAPTPMGESGIAGSKTKESGGGGKDNYITQVQSAANKIDQLKQAKTSGVTIDNAALSGLVDELKKINKGIETLNNENTNEINAIKNLNTKAEESGISGIAEVLKPAMDHINKIKIEQEKNINNMIEKSLPSNTPADEKETLKVNLGGEIPIIKMNELRGKTREDREKVFRNYDKLTDKKTQYNEWVIKQEQKNTTAEKPEQVGQASTENKRVGNQTKTNEQFSLNQFKAVMDSSESYDSAKKEIYARIQQEESSHPGPSF